MNWNEGSYTLSRIYDQFLPCHTTTIPGTGRRNVHTFLAKVADRVKCPGKTVWLRLCKFY